MKSNIGKTNKRRVFSNENRVSIEVVMAISKPAAQMIDFTIIKQHFFTSKQVGDTGFEPVTSRM